MDPDANVDQLLHVAWGLIANAYGGAWNLASEEWRKAAEAWRDDYHEFLEARLKATK